MSRKAEKDDVTCMNWMALQSSAKRLCSSRFGEFCCCCCLPLLPVLASSIHAAWPKPFLYRPCRNILFAFWDQKHQTPPCRCVKFVDDPICCGQSENPPLEKGVESSFLVSRDGRMANWGDSTRAISDRVTSTHTQCVRRMIQVKDTIQCKQMTQSIETNPNIPSSNIRLRIYTAQKLLSKHHRSWCCLLSRGVKERVGRAVYHNQVTENQQGCWLDW